MDDCTFEKLKFAHQFTPNPGGGGGNAPSGASIWDHCGAGCYKWLFRASNFSAGAGRVLSGGLTTKYNDYTGASKLVDRNSTAFSLGTATGAGVGVTLAVGGGLTAAASQGGKYGPLFGKGLADGTQSLFNGALRIAPYIRFGWYWAVSRDAIGLRLGEKGDFIHWHIPFWHP